MKEQALALKAANGGKNPVTLRTPNKQIRYDLDGAPHNGIETPHKQVYNFNFVNKVVRSISKAEKNPEAFTKQDMRIVRKFFANLQKNSR